MERYSQGVPKMSARPPGKLELPPHQVTRCRTRGKITGHVTSNNITGCMIHFYRGRSRPCTLPGACEACSKGNAARWESYFSAWDIKTGREFTVAITRAAVPFFSRAFKQYGSLRGLSFVIWRCGDKPNSRLAAELRPSNLDPAALPKEPPLVKMLFHMWEVSTGYKLKLHPEDGVTAEESQQEKQA